MIDKEMDNRIKQCSKIANKVVRYVQKEIKTLCAMGETDPILVQDMSLAYAMAIARLMIYKGMQDNNLEADWEHIKEGAHKALEIALQHTEDQFIKPPKTEVNECVL